MKNTRRQFAIGAGVIMMASAAKAQFGGLPGGLGGGNDKGNDKGSGNIDTDVKTFLDKSIAIEKTLNAASLAIVGAYATESDRAQLQGKLDAINKLTEPKEASTQFQQVSESTSAEIKKLAAESDLSEKTKNLSAAKKKQLSAGIANFLLGALRAKDLVPTGQTVMKAVSGNPMSAGKVLPVKDALPRLGNAISLASDTLPQLIKVMKGANIKIPEVTATSKEETFKEI
jgi:hypothetical protein